MMNLARTALLGSTAAALLLVAACGDKGGKAPTGQVVATVDGKEVTIHEVNGEIDALPNRGAGAPRKLVESIALARVIERKMLAEEAEKRGLGKNPKFILARERADETLLVQALQADIAQKVPVTTREAAQKFIAENPNVFGDRKIFTLDQIQFLRPANFAALGLKDAKTMADVEKLLIDANIEYRRAPQQVDALTVNPALTAEILKISAASKTEPFMFADQPAGAPAPIIYINLITDTKTQPFTGEKAIGYAQQVLQRQEVQKKLASELKRFDDAAKGKIVYAKDYGPPVFPKNPAAAAAANMPATAAAKPGAPATAPAVPAKTPG